MINAIEREIYYGLVVHHRGVSAMRLYSIILGLLSELSGFVPRPSSAIGIHWTELPDLGGGRNIL